MASGRFETKCIGPLETVSLACNSGTVATVTLTATAISTDQNACLSISMSDVPTCPEFTSCYGSIGTGQLGTLGCLISPARSCANAYAGYRKMAFDKVCGVNSCCGGPYMQQYSAANTLFQASTNPVGFCGRDCPFNIPPAIESLCYCANFSNCCCSTQKGFNTMYIPDECCGGYRMWLVKKCCFQRFGGSLTDDCYYQLISKGTCHTCQANCSCATNTPTAFGGFGRACIPGCGNCDVAIDWWHNGKFIWAVFGEGCTQCICAPFVHYVNPYTLAGDGTWTAGDNQDCPCTQGSIYYQCCLNNYPNGIFCTHMFGGSPKGQCAKCLWGIPCQGLYGFYPMVMTGCNLQVYQHAFSSIGAMFRTTQCCAPGSATPWCGQGFYVYASHYNCCTTTGLLIQPGGGCNCEMNPDRPHNFVRWITYNHIDKQNYFMWYHQCTPTMNGIYSVSEAQLHCIYCHQANGGCCCSAGSYQCTDSVINTKFATKQSCVPTIWCAAYAKAWCMLNTNVFASGCCEWSMFASPTDWGTSALCFCRFFSKDLINWNQHDSNGCTYKQEVTNTPTSTCYIDFNASTCDFEYNCSNYAALPTGNTAILEHFTTTGKLERSGIVMGATDRFYVKNTSNSISASVTVWGFNE